MSCLASDEEGGDTIILGHFGLNGYEAKLAGILKRLDFHSLLINGMLSYLLFAGALTVNIQDLKAQTWEVGVLPAWLQ